MAKTAFFKAILKFCTTNKTFLTCVAYQIKTHVYGAAHGVSMKEGLLRETQC